MEALSDKIKAFLGSGSGSGYGYGYGSGYGSGYGYGWRLNYSQSIEEVSFQNGNKAQTFFKLTDGDGTRHYYKKQSDSSAKYVNELDKNSTLTVNTGSKLIDNFRLILL